MIAAGECPVDREPFTVLVAQGSGAIVYWCRWCELAVSHLPAPGVLDEVAALEELAPAGTREPSDIEVARLQRSGVAITRS